MTNFSRRQLAGFAADQLAQGQSVKIIANQLAAALITSNRQKQVDLLISDIYQELEVRGVSAHAVVTTARPMSVRVQSQLQKRLKELLKVGNVSFQPAVDEKLLGGIKVQTATRLWDDTLARRLLDLMEVY